MVVIMVVQVEVLIHNIETVEELELKKMDFLMQELEL